MEVTSLAEDVPVPPSPPRVLTVALLCVAMLCACLSTARRADALDGRVSPQLVQVKMYPRQVEEQPTDDADAEDDTAGGSTINVKLPAHLLMQLRTARATGDLDRFEDVAHELALRLV